MRMHFHLPPLPRESIFTYLTKHRARRSQNLARDCVFNCLTILGSWRFLIFCKDRRGLECNTGSWRFPRFCKDCRGIECNRGREATKKRSSRGYNAPKIGKYLPFNPISLYKISECFNVAN